jgi:hypothetical protein
VFEIEKLYAFGDYSFIPHWNRKLLELIVDMERPLGQ